MLRDPAAGVMYSPIYVGFLVLFAVTTVLEIDHQMPESWKFLHGDVYRSHVFVGDTAGVVFLTGLLWTVECRYIRRVYRITIKSRAEHAVVLATFILIGVTGFATEVLRVAIDGQPEFERWTFVSYPLSGPDRVARCGWPVEQRCRVQGRLQSGDGGQVAQAVHRTRPRRSARGPATGLAARSGISPSSVARIWRAFGLKPWLTDTFQLSEDPQFIDKVRNVVGLYMNPPEHVVVMCVDEKTSIQALDRPQPSLPIRPGQIERQRPHHLEGQPEPFVRHRTADQILDSLNRYVMNR